MTGTRGFPAALTSFVGRAGQVDEVAGLLAGYRLVTVTGPGGVGKTRLAGEVARRVAGRFADGVWLVELARVQDPVLVEAVVASALGVRQAGGASLADSLVAALAWQQLLLVVDNCEHVLAGVAGLCGRLLPAADDVRILVTSREPVGVAGEARYRLPPLTVPGLESGSGTAGSEAVALFTDRARQADPHFVLDPEAARVVARLVVRLDGMPLAIELAAARVEELGVAQLADRLDDRFALLASGDRLAAPRHRSLAATADWSYQLLDDRERQVFRKLAVLPGPFTLEGAEAVAGADAGQAVLHLVGCSLVSPPRTGPDGRVRYVMLETLRAYGAERLAEAHEEPGTAAALAGYVLAVAEQASTGLRTSTGELDAARWLEAEEATVHHVLVWAMEHDTATAARLAVTLAPWWFVRGRWSFAYELLRTAAVHAERGGQDWCAAQFWLGMFSIGFDHTVSLGHFDAARAALTERPPSPLLCLTLSSRAICVANLGQIAEANGEIRRALALARQIADLAGEATALMCLAITAYYSDDPEASMAWGRQAGQIGTASLPGWLSRERNKVVALALAEAGELASARRACAAGLEAARHADALYDQSDCLVVMADVDLRAGHLPEATAHLHEATEIAVRLGGNLLLVPSILDLCGHLCALTNRPAAAVTAWAAYAASEQRSGMPSLPQDTRRRAEPLRKARQALGPAEARVAEERGAAMTMATAAEYALLVTEEAEQPAAGPGPPRLSAREQELVALVAQGRTNAQIAGQLFISVRTVSSHLDRIRDKTGCRRRADLTRLALQAGLV